MKRKKTRRSTKGFAMLDEFLRREGKLEEFEAVATEEARAWQIAEEMKRQRLLRKGGPPPHPRRLFASSLPLPHLRTRTGERVAEGWRGSSFDKLRTRTARSLPRLSNSPKLGEGNFLVSIQPTRPQQLPSFSIASGREAGAAARSSR
jgi:hypothetical protein